MANTYSQINIHIVFSVKGRENLLSKSIRDELFPYISGICKNIELFPLAVNGWQDHTHVFFELKPDVSISKAVETIKGNSSKWINDRKFLKRRFEWQRGYGAFSYSRSQRPNVIEYIMRQEEHHQISGNSFKNEYLNLLKNFNIKFDQRYVFDFYE